MKTAATRLAETAAEATPGGAGANAVVVLVAAAVVEGVGDTGPAAVVDGAAVGGAVGGDGVGGSVGARLGTSVGEKVCPAGSGVGADVGEAVGAGVCTAKVKPTAAKGSTMARAVAISAAFGTVTGVSVKLSTV